MIILSFYKTVLFFLISASVNIELAELVPLKGRYYKPLFTRGKDNSSSSHGGQVGDAELKLQCSSPRPISCS